MTYPFGYGIMGMATEGNGTLRHHTVENSPIPGLREQSLEAAMARLTAEVHEGLRHGHFKIGITCEITGAGRRALVLESGKTYRFLIAESELQN